MSRCVPNKAVPAALAALVLALQPGVTAAAAPAPHEYLDQETAASVTVVGQPLVFANPRTELAANARDYVTLAAAGVDRSGKLTFVAIVYFWSTVDPRMRTDPLAAPPKLVLEADDRRIELLLRGHSPHDAGIGVPVDPPPGPGVPPSVYGVDLGTLQFIAAARELTLLVEDHGSVLRYALWDDQRGALQALVARLGGGG